MEIKLFFKDKLPAIFMSIFVAMFSAFLLHMVNANIYFTLFVPCTYILGHALIVTIEFLIKNRYYKQLFATLDGLDKKCLLSEIMPKSNFYESAILTQILKETNKSMNDEIAKYSHSSAEYREYIELWVHEVKTPIAGAKLICENMQNDTVSQELDRIEKLVEQALFYSRSEGVEKDYLIKQVTLKDIVNPLLRKNARRLIERKISVEVKDLNVQIFADSKWINFILGQLLDNALKYKSKKLEIYSEQNPNSVSLYIRDDGIGIPKQDINRVFNKGFTGENGRNYAKSTGIGLYLCKKLCDKMAIAIRLESTQGEGTCLEIIFPKSNMYS